LKVPLTKASASTKLVNRWWKTGWYAVGQKPGCSGAQLS